MIQLADRAAWGAALCMAMAAATAGTPVTMAENAAVIPLPEQQTLRVSGVIGPDFEPDVDRALQRHPEIRRIVVASPGGMRAQALRVGQLANRRGMTVRVEGRCSSACVLLWATAAAREMTAGSRIGLHRSSLDRDLPIPAVMREQLIRRNDRETDEVLLKAGFPVRVVEQGAATPPTTMAWFTPDQLDGVSFVLLDHAPAEPAAADRSARIALGSGEATARASQD